MDSPLESSPSRKAQSNKLAVFSSIENRSDILEGRKLTSKSLASDEMNNKTQNIRPLAMDTNSTKRYSIPQNYKDSFYAIHHIQRSIKENERMQLESSQSLKDENSSSPITPSVTTTAGENTEPLKNKKSTTNGGGNRGRKRLAPDQSSQLNKAADHTSPSLFPVQQQQDSVKRKRSRQQNKIRKSSGEQHSVVSNTPQPSLYQTCVGLWPDSQQSLGDLSHDNIKALSNLLKVRLSQAKFKMMAKLDQDNELFTFLAEEYVPPRPRLPYAIKLSGKQNKATMSVVGNGKNLFARNNKIQNRTFSTITNDMDISMTKHTPSTPKDQITDKLDVVASPQRQPTTKTKERKKRTPRTPGTKTKRTSTPKRKSAAADIAPVTLSDGSSVYVCEPCHKKYKNRNGLAYHLERCKNTVKHDDGEEEDGEEKEPSHTEESVINCVCAQNTDEHGTMVQCDKCRIWLHSECVGLAEDVLDDLFHCTSCKEELESNTQHKNTQHKNTQHSDTSEPKHKGKDLLQCLMDAQASDREEQSISSQEQINNHLQDLFSQTPKKDDEHAQSEDDDVFSIPLEFPNEDDSSEADMNTHDSINENVPGSTQLHVWDDFSFSSTLEKSNEPWSILEDEEPFSNYDTDIPSSSWTMNDIGIFSQPPSLLFSDATMTSALDEELNSAPLIGDLATPVPISEVTPLPMSESTPICEATPVCEATLCESTPICEATLCESTPICETTPVCGEITTPVIVSSTNTPIHTADGLWFQFANFDDDYQCET